MDNTLATNITEDQLKRYKRLIEDAADKALMKVDLCKNSFQQVIENRNELQMAIVAKLKELSATNKYADEEVKSEYGYLSGYKPQDIVLQIARLKQLFSEELKNATYDETLTEQLLPPNAEGWFAIPRFEVVATNYNDAVQKILALIRKDRKGRFFNWRKDKLGESYLRQSARAIQFWKQIGEEQQKHKILIVPAQFGLRHRGRSFRRARAVFTTNEFGLGTFAVGIMLLTHPNRLKRYDDLWIDCAGDEYAPSATDDFSIVPYFHFYGGKVEFFTYWVDDEASHSGSASAIKYSPQ
jgi:hypothetical protein